MDASLPSFIGPEWKSVRLQMENSFIHSRRPILSREILKMYEAWSYDFLQMGNHWRRMPTGSSVVEVRQQHYFCGGWKMANCSKNSVLLLALIFRRMASHLL